MSRCNNMNVTPKKGIEVLSLTQEDHEEVEFKISNMVENREPTIYNFNKDCSSK